MINEASGQYQSKGEVTKLPPPNKAAIENLFKRACHTVNSHSPVDMSDPSTVSRVLGELFANMHEEETKWASELAASKGWVCDLPEKLGGGTYSWTAVNSTTSRVQVSGNSKWSSSSAVEFQEADRAELQKIMQRFVQEGALLEIPSESAAAAATSLAASSSTQNNNSRITIMRDNKEQMRIFQVKDNADARKNLVSLLELAQRVNQRNTGAEATAAGLQAF